MANTILYSAAALHTVLYVALQTSISLLSLPRLVHQHLIHNGAAAEKNYRVKDAYALVTGATDGIGKALVEELAARGWNVIIHGRSTQKLEPLIHRLSDQYPNQHFLPFLADASKSPEELKLPELLRQFKGCNITLLINNVGGLPPVKALSELTDEEIIQNVHVNVSFGVCLTRVILKEGLLARKSCILSLGSIGSIMTLPGTPTYSASKAFTTKFNACLREQLASQEPIFRTDDIATKSVEIISIIPGGVRTAMTPIDHASYSPFDGRTFLVTPAAFARATLGKIGLGQYYREIYSCWRHEFQMGVLTAFPEEWGVRAWINRLLMKAVDGPRAEGWKRLGAGWKMVDGKLVGPDTGGRKLD
ncbi:NAD(P)-binding protein [Morchella conica CCBAS932]|uniref:NAD(P)-binding protein n=1 Tax=Morchella conica CCBAS932 TaxID=1392247 RepID=A0A3N4KVN1_9PEZI|nr:NAD(P)-binding protein [Morchella conica CCBAS932]